VRRIAARARAREDALFLEYGSKRPLTVIASFSMSPRDSAWHMTYVAVLSSAMGQNLAIRHLGRVIYFEILSITAWPGRFRRRHQVVVTYKRTTLGRSGDRPAAI